MTYVITHDHRNAFTWRAEQLSQTGTGQIHDTSVFASWRNDDGTGSDEAFGVVEMIPGEALLVRWANGVIFRREYLESDFPTLTTNSDSLSKDICINLESPSKFVASDPNADTIDWTCYNCAPCSIPGDFCKKVGNSWKPLISKRPWTISPVTEGPSIWDAGNIDRRWFPDPRQGWDVLWSAPLFMDRFRQRFWTGAERCVPRTVWG